MPAIHVEDLRVESFLPFGFFADLIHPSGEKIGTAPITFFRDMLQAPIDQQAASFSVCEVLPRALRIEEAEYHTATAEATLPLDGDVIVYVGAATPGGIPGPLRAFRVPLGTMIVLRPGVWHGAPFAVGDGAVRSLVVLPERTYANDCVVKKLQDALELVADP